MARKEAKAAAAAGGGSAGGDRDAREAAPAPLGEPGARPTGPLVAPRPGVAVPPSDERPSTPLVGSGTPGPVPARPDGKSRDKEHRKLMKSLMKVLTERQATPQAQGRGPNGGSGEKGSDEVPSGEGPAEGTASPAGGPGDPMVGDPGNTGSPGLPGGPRAHAQSALVGPVVEETEEERRMRKMERKKTREDETEEERAARRARKKEKKEKKQAAAS
eukprot:jgi/Botrbrau1/11005/Bobra.101_1s0003.1